MRIIGIDPGTLNVGFGIVEEDGNALRFIAGGCIKARGEDIAQRLVTIHHGLAEVLQEYRPQEAGVETVFTGHNPKTAIAIGEGRGVVLLTLAEAGLRIAGYEPSVVKRAVTASGKAAKEQVLRMVQVLLNLAQPPESDHEADALALAITHSHRRNIAALGAATGVAQRNSRGLRRIRR